jgi:hypothetical protein
MSIDRKDQAEKPQGALLDARQIALLKKAIVVMSVILVAGFLTVLGRIAYLMTRGGESAAPATPAVAAASALQPAIKLALPAGATVRSVALAGQRLVVHYSARDGDGIAILDLATGQTVSRVRIESDR